ncbi:MAG: hypothetical protein JWM11_1062 [Planctomycetaceae bacterium]|nr:hypothetical protein [Planctomycetaceae bacterium]
MGRFRFALYFVLIASLWGNGCHSEKPSVKVFPVYGKILIDGKPPVRAELRFKPKTPINDPVKRSIEPHAIVGPDGMFEVGTYLGDDGAPPGEYAITVVWPTVTIEGGEETFGPDRLKERFANPASPIARIEVKEDDNRIPVIELKTH